MEIVGSTLQALLASYKVIKGAGACENDGDDDNDDDDDDGDDGDGDDGDDGDDVQTQVRSSLPLMSKLRPWRQPLSDTSDQKLKQ